MGNAMNIRRGGNGAILSGVNVMKPRKKLVHHGSRVMVLDAQKSVGRHISLVERMAEGDMKCLQDGAVLVTEHQRASLVSNPHANTTLTKKQLKKLKRRAQHTVLFMQATQGKFAMKD